MGAVMMHVCDICGVLIRDQECRKPANKLEIAINRAKIEPYSHIKFERADLCPTCQNEFELFVNRRRVRTMRSNEEDEV